jgi:signal transduction histidine kinase
MDEVSCRAIGIALDALGARDIPHELLVEGLPISVTEISDQRRRIDWNLFTIICERLEKLCGGPETLAQIGRDHFRTESFSMLRSVASVFTQPRDIYWLGTVWFGRTLFSIIEDHFEDLPDGRVREILRIPPPYRDCPQLFHIFHGALAVAPSMVGQEDAQVELELLPRQATYTITLPERAALSRRLVRRAVTPFAARRLIGELSFQQSELKQSHDRLRAAHRKIAAQAEDLKRINLIGRELAKQIELEELADILVEMLRIHVPGRGIAIWLQPLGGEPESELRRVGDTTGTPTRVLLLKTADRPVGRVEVWEEPAGKELEEGQRGVDLLDELISWIAMALDNARSYEALADRNALLLERVKEHSARLRAANGDLEVAVAERKRADEALLQSEEQLRAAERLASIGTLAAGIAHEINNPVSSILAAAQYAIACRDDPNSQQIALQALEDIARQSLRCGSIVRSVLQFSRDEPADRWLADVNELVQRAAWSIRRGGGESETGIQLDLCTSPCQAVMNPIEIGQVLAHLLRNATQASASSSPIRVETRAQEDRVQIRVIDEGQGIGPSELKRIFDPFFTTRRDSGATGFGLSVAHGIVTGHGGTLEVESRPGAGTTISISLPRGKA